MQDFSDYVDFIFTQLEGILEFLIGLGVFLMVVFALRFVFASHNPEQRGKLKNALVYGFIILFVMFSFWALVNFSLNSFTVG